MKVLKTRIDFFKERPGMVMAELGVYNGDFSRELLQYDPILYLVDIWQGACSSADKDGKNNTRIDDMFNTYLALSHEFRPQNVILIRGRSAEFLKGLPDNFLDAVYIDTDHSFETTKLELNYSLYKVKDGGWICGHDYVNLTPGVIQAVDEFTENTGLHIEYLAEDGCPSYFIRKI